MTRDPVPLPLTEEYTFTEEALIAAADKWQIIGDWQRFLLSGFKQLFFSRALYLQLTQTCGFIAHFDQTQFWRFYFASDVSRLRAFLNQFGGNRQAAENGGHDWLDDPAADLKAAMCQVAERLYLPLSQVLQDLEYKQTELVQAWHEFALAAGMTDLPWPAPYQVSENSRNLLAYAAQIALQQPPLSGLQLRFPLEEPLFQEVILDG